MVRKNLYRKLHALAVPLGNFPDALLTDSVISHNSISDISNEKDSFSCGTDGSSMYWGTSTPSEELLLHNLIHCLFGHPFLKPRGFSDEDWSLVCDISAWSIALHWIPELVPERIKIILQNRNHELASLSLYDAANLLPYLPEIKAHIWSPEFSCDSHILWPVFRPESLYLKKHSISGNGGSMSGEGWEKLKKKLTGRHSPLSLERKEWTKNAGASDEFRPGHRPVKLTGARRHDYRSLLRSLASWGEEAWPDEEEFEYASYFYGISRFGNLPLIEPLEYRERKKIKELAIVIDTSASCSGSLTQVFLEETRNLLAADELFFHPFNLHILQCDTAVRRDDKITSLEDLSDFIEGLEIHGMGGTDFRPAFSYIESLKQKQEFTDLSGILYFSDGIGLYPDHPPDTRTVFLFLKDHFDDIDLPDWAERLILNTI